ncbi:MAG: hypothetical protein GXO29_04500 [Thermotogae bacterium]|nr:hypothetical protein [Thermotogota bacterium]
MTAIILSLMVVERGDVLVVSVFGADEYRVETPVLDDCTAFFPLVGTLEVCGMNMDELSDTLSKLLKPYYDLPVIVSVKNVQPLGVMVLGEVQKPGMVPYVKGMTLADALTMAGALPTADVARITLNGKGVDLKVSNPRLKPGDRIVVPKSLWASAREFLPVAMSALSLGILVYNTFIKK